MERFRVGTNTKAAHHGMEYAWTGKPNWVEVEKLQEASLRFPLNNHDPGMMDGDQNP